MKIVPISYPFRKIPTMEIFLAAIEKFQNARQKDPTHIEIFTDMFDQLTQDCKEIEFDSVIPNKRVKITVTSDPTWTNFYILVS